MSRTFSQAPDPFAAEISLATCSMACLSKSFCSSSSRRKSPLVELKSDEIVLAGEFAIEGVALVASLFLRQCRGMSTVASERPLSRDGGRSGGKSRLRNERCALMDFDRSFILQEGVVGRMVAIAC
jgi:hypothetical protein